MTSQSVAAFLVRYPELECSKLGVVGSTSSTIENQQLTGLGSVFIAGDRSASIECFKLRLPCSEPANA